MAILTTHSFDSKRVDPNTVRFGVRGTEAPGFNARRVNIDGDGDRDLVLYFRIQQTGIQCGTRLVFLTGKTKDGRDIPRHGYDPDHLPLRLTRSAGP